MALAVDIKSFWTEGYTDQIPNSDLHTKCMFHDFFVCLVLIMDLGSDLSLLKEFSKMLIFEKFTFFIKFFTTEAFD